MKSPDVFEDGDEVVLALGSNRGTFGVFLCLRPDPRWADITERNGIVKMHPTEWLAHAPKASESTGQSDARATHVSRPVAGK